MYLELYGLKEAPFSLTPDTSFYYNYISHQEALNVLLVALRNGEGFIKITGEIGLGKTLLCRKLLNSLGGQYVTAYIPNPHLSPGSMRFAIAQDIGLNLNPRTTQEMLLQAITRRLIELAREGKRVVVCLDEAQELPDKTLEAVRLLTNLETEKSKLLQVALFGQPELDSRLKRRDKRQLRQRITFSYKLKPMDSAHVTAYVRHRLRIAGYRGGALFTPRALTELDRASRGIPRVINILCHKALMAAFGMGSEAVTHKHMRQAISDTEGVHRPFTLFGRPLFVAVFIALGIISAGLVLVSGALP